MSDRCCSQRILLATQLELCAPLPGARGGFNLHLQFPAGGIFRVRLLLFCIVGETPDFEGQQVTVNTIDSWPVPDPNNPYPSVVSNVQRSFVVEGGHGPAVAVAVGVVVALESGTELNSEDVSGVYLSGQSPRAGIGCRHHCGLRYDPLSPEIKTP